MASKRYEPRKSPRQRRASETRARILDAAARVFAERGYAAGTTNRIAEAAAMSIGSLYQYFPNKDAILVELVKAHVNEGLEAIQRHLSAVTEPMTLEQRVRLFVRATIDNHAGEPALHRVLFEEAPRPPELLEMFRTAEQWIVAAATELLRSDPEVQVKDTAMAARLSVYAIESLVHRFFAAGGADFDRLEDELTAMVAGYLRVPGT